MRNEKGQFIKGHKYLEGSEKGRFKKGILIMRNEKGQFIKGHKYLEGSEKGRFKKGYKPSEKTVQVARDRMILMNEKDNPSKRPEVKEKMRIAKLGTKWNESQRKKLSGENSSKWKGGITNDKKQYKKIKKHEYRSRKFKADGKYSLEEWLGLKKKYNYMCLCCKRYEPEIVLSVDHIIPLSSGGSNNIDNIQPLCCECNSIKNIKIIDFRGIYAKII